MCSLQADRSLDSLRAELEERGLLVRAPEVHVEDVLCALDCTERGQKVRDIESEHTLYAIRNRLMELCVLPLVSPLVRER
jgi:hypothetical protein